MYFLLLLILINAAIAVNDVNVYFFYGQGCSYCASEEVFLDELEENYPTLNVLRYEVYNNNEARELFFQCSALAGTSVQKVPTTFIDSKPYVGFGGDISEQIESEVQRCLVENCSDILTQDNSSSCEIEVEYDTEEYVGYGIIGLIALAVLFLIIKKLMPKRKAKK